MHHRRAYLYAACTEQHKFDRIAPIRNAADAADRNREVLLARKFGDHIQSDRFDGRPAIAAVRSLAALEG